MDIHFAQFDYIARTGLGYGLVGQVDEGLALVNEALEKLEMSNDRQAEAIIRRIKGDLLLMQELPAVEYEIAQQQAEACFRRAIKVAQQQQAKLWEARALVSLYRLLKRQGRDEGTREQLAELYDWFTEGFETEDLRLVREVLQKT
jgi:tetratricopeptide (TPR) repeat protein